MGLGDRESRRRARLLLILLAASVLLSSRASVASEALAPVSLAQAPHNGDVIMSLEPQATTVAVGETFTVRVVVQAGGRRVDGVQCFLNFNYKLLRARSVTTSPPLELLILNNIDNELGHVDYVAGMPFGSEAPSGTFELMTLTLQALAPTAGTTLAFSKQAPRESAVSFGLEGALPLQTLDSRITVVLRAPTPTRPPFVRLPLVLRMR